MLPFLMLAMMTLAIEDHAWGEAIFYFALFLLFADWTIGGRRRANG